MNYLNIAGYKFVKLTNLDGLRSSLKALAIEAGLKGTILISEEGVNAFLCGQESDIERFLTIAPTPICDIEFKRSFSEQCPFSRMLVKIKTEIVPLGVPGISPADHPAPNLPAKQFKEWCDTGKPMVILDTRNDYEFHLGKFKNAIHLNIQHFRNFAHAIRQLPPEFKDKTIVTYCTGGIRCEKAAPFLMQEGFKDVYQLEGGILKYFEEVGQGDFIGECFVFDKRIAVDDELKETHTVQCFACRQPVTLAEQKTSQYKEGDHCPQCYN